MLQGRGRRSCVPPPDHTALTDIRRGSEASISDAEITAAERRAREARTLHLRRHLEAATGCGAAMLAALGLPRLAGPDFVPLEREAARSALDQAIATLDAPDGDPDLEDGADDGCKLLDAYQAWLTYERDWLVWKRHGEKARLRQRMPAVVWRNPETGECFDYVPHDNAGASFDHSGATTRAAVILSAAGVPPAAEGRSQAPPSSAVQLRTTATSTRSARSSAPSCG